MVKIEVKIISKNGFQSGAASAYCPSYIRNLSKGSVDY